MNHCIAICLLISLTICESGYSQISEEDFVWSTYGQGASKRISAVFVHKVYQQKVHANFNRQDYKGAFNGYSRLARHNDKLAQYRLAYMYTEGLGVEKDLIQAYAWSQLSKESKPIDQDRFQHIYTNLYAYIVNQLDSVQLEQAKELATSYYSEYSMFATAIRARIEIQRAKSKCTGSLVGSCDRAKVKATFNPSCNLYTDRGPGNDCLTYASVGMHGVSGMNRSYIHHHLDRLDQVIERYDPGRVELRELEIDDSPIIERS